MPGRGGLACAPPGGRVQNGDTYHGSILRLPSAVSAFTLLYIGDIPQQQRAPNNILALHTDRARWRAGVTGQIRPATTSVREGLTGSAHGLPDALPVSRFRSRRTPNEAAVDQAVSEELPYMQDRGATRQRGRGACHWDM